MIGQRISGACAVVFYVFKLITLKITQGWTGPSRMARLVTEPAFPCAGCFWPCPCPSTLRSTFCSSCYSSFTWPALWIEDRRLTEVVVFSVASTQGSIFDFGKTIECHLFDLTWALPGHPREYPTALEFGCRSSAGPTRLLLHGRLYELEVSVSEERLVWMMPAAFLAPEDLLKWVVSVAM
jgi:hypothetical protein